MAASMFGREGYEQKMGVVRGRSTHQDILKRRERADGVYREHGIDYVLNKPRVAHVLSSIPAASYNAKFTRSERGKLPTIHRIAETAHKEGHGRRYHFTIEGAINTDHERIDHVNITSGRRPHREVYVSAPVTDQLRAYSGLPARANMEYHNGLRSWLASGGR